MIPDEIRNGIEAKCDIHESKIIAGIKARIPEWIEENSDSLQHVQSQSKCLIIKMKHPVSGRTNIWSSEAT